MLQAYGVTDKGRTRPTNEDCFAIDEELRLCVVADGMGGHNAGEVAARMAVAAAVEFIAGLHGCQREHDAANWPFGFDPSLSRGGNLLRTAINLANLQILETAASSEEYAGMGTTIVAAMVEGEKLSVGHVGDSRLYLVANNRIRQVTRDDSWMASALADDPRADPDPAAPSDAPRADQRGRRPAAHRSPCRRRTTRGGELLVLSTDGVHDVLDDDRLRTARARRRQSSSNRDQTWSAPPSPVAAAITARPSSLAIFLIRKHKWANGLGRSQESLPQGFFSVPGSGLARSGVPGWAVREGG